MVDLDLHDPGDLSVPLGATPHLPFRPQRMFTQFMDGGMIVILDLIGHWQVRRIENPRLAAEQL